MDEEDCYAKKGAGSSFQSPNSGSNLSFMTDDQKDLEGTEKLGDLGDMTFYMTNYIKDAMKMMFIMRSHHMLTDVILEVGSELFHAHKVILAAASPYFKVIYVKVLISNLYKDIILYIDKYKTYCIIYNFTGNVYRRFKRI